MIGSFMKTRYGYVGFMITRGLWYKLRVYNYDKKGLKFKISEPQIYDVKSYSDALFIMEKNKNKNYILQMNSEQLEQFLQSKMKTNTFRLTELLENSTKKITNGFVGYQITRGLWVKLRIYTCFYLDEQLLLEEILNESFWSLQSAKKKANEIIRSYK